MTKVTPWLIPLNSCRAPVMRLFCCHHAGGNATQYRGWGEAFEDSIELIGIQLPGRRERLAEPPVSCVQAAAGQIAEEIARHGLNSGPIALFGQSLGALVAYELASTLQAQYQIGVRHLIVACAKAPHLMRHVEPVSQLSDLQFIAHLRSYGGTEDEILADTDLMLLLCSTMKADFRMVELYRASPYGSLRSAVTALGGADDKYVSEADLAAWQLATRGHFSHLMLAGGHFLSPASETLMMRHIRTVLLEPHEDELHRAGAQSSLDVTADCAASDR
jgi:pyochelin biosynthetic protein PchC